ncbi:MAG: YdeI/OmpD-associated family protein [Pseudomonadota bacterium]
MRGDRIGDLKSAGSPRSPRARAANSPTAFATPAAFRAWLEVHHEAATELLVVFYKVDSGKPSITWSQSVDEALCFGWIDGVRRSLGKDAYSIRFTPRKRASIWSTINVNKVADLERRGKMRPAGRRAFAARTAEKTGVYSFERKEPAVLPAGREKALRAHAKAAAYFDARPPWYRRAAIHWVQSAKQEETRERRFQQLLADSAAGRTIPSLTRPQGAPKKTKGNHQGGTR